MIRPGHLDSIKMITITCWNINWSLLLISLLICTFPRNKNSPSPRDWYRNLFDLCQEPSRPRFISIAPPHSLRGITPFDLRSAFVRKKNTIRTTIVRGSQKTLPWSEWRKGVTQANGKADSTWFCVEMNHPTPLQGELGSLGEQKRIMERLHKLSPNVCGSKTTVAELVFPKKRCNSFFANLISCRLLCAHWDYDSSMPSNICRRTSYRAFDVRLWRKFKSPFNKGDNQSNNQNGNLRWIFPLGVGPPHPYWT